MYFEIDNFYSLYCFFLSLRKVSIYGNPKISEKSILQIGDLFSYAEGFVFDP